MNDLGFGTVFDGDFGGGKFENISTQAVFDLMRNVKVPEENDPPLVAMDVGEIEDFNIPREEAILPDQSNDLGNYFILTIFDNKLLIFKSWCSLLQWKLVLLGVTFNFCEL